MCFHILLALKNVEVAVTSLAAFNGIFNNRNEAIKFVFITNETVFGIVDISNDTHAMEDLDLQNECWLKSDGLVGEGETHSNFKIDGQPLRVY